MLGLRRSGTTIFWKTLRDNTAFRSFNEPFNPLITRLADPSWRSVATEYYRESLDLLGELGSSYWELFEPIHPAQELRPRFSDSQERYLSHLLSSCSDVLIETTRCHFKVRAIADLASPDAVLVHLYRSPAGFATSHLIPSGRHPIGLGSGFAGPGGGRRLVLGARAGLRRALNRRSFWARHCRYDNWGVESIVGRGSRSPFFLLAAERGLDAERVERMPAVGKLLAFWKLCYDVLEEAGRKHFGKRFVSVNLERWAGSPEPVLEEILGLVGVEATELNVSSVRRPGAAYQPGNPAWRELFEALGIHESQLGEPDW